MYQPIPNNNRIRCGFADGSDVVQESFSGRAPGFRAYTLMEILLVVAIIACIVGLVMPNFMGRLSRDVFVEDVNKFVSTLRLTANEAMFRGQSLVVILDVTTGYYTVYEKRADNIYNEDVEPLIERQGLDFSYIQIAEYGDGSQQFSGEMELLATPEGWSDSWLFEIIDLQDRLKWVRTDRMTTRVVQSDQPLEIMAALPEVSITSSL